MQLFLDIDGVILDFEQGFMEYIRQTYHPDLPLGYRPKTWEMDNEFKDVDIMVAWDDFVDSTAFRQLELIPEKALFIELAQTYEIHLVTNLPPTLREARLANLHYHGLPFESLSLGGHHDFNIPDYPSKSSLIQALRKPNQPMAFVDDHPVNCQDVASTFADALVILMNRPHNINIDLPYPRVDHWNQITPLLQAHANHH